MLYNKQIFKRCFSFPARYWYKNLKYIPLYFQQLHFLVKHGYDEYATWETFNWFITTMRDVLRRYRGTHISYPYDQNSDPDTQWDSWNSTIDKMISLLDDMDEDNEKYKDMDMRQMRAPLDAAKDEFFALFAKYFYHLWD